MDGGSLIRSDEVVTPRFRAACIDCPAARVGCFKSCVSDGVTACRFVKATISARASLPRTWAAQYAFALVRRGVLVRTRPATRGQDVAIDCAGTGSLVPWAPDAPQIGFAATELLVCLFPREGLIETLARDPSAANDVIEGLGAALNRVERYAEARGQRSAESRVVATLSVLADTLSPPVRRQRLPATFQQRDLAALADVRRASVLRLPGKLEREG
ncbi:MAG: hypothetical protein K1X94_30880, partial [Sandaracinaceae bacterium]|nr:hypothetical protein [Sandaracinaceae bacterium]